MLKDVNAKRCIEEECMEVQETVAMECKVTICVGDHIFSTYATPDELTELVIGHLICAGYANKRSDIGPIEIETNDENIEIRANADKKDIGNSIEALRVDKESIYKMNSIVIENSDLFDKTGAFHYAYIFDAEANLLLSAYDVGRMNAIDKVIGKAALKGTELNDKVLYTTGRVASRTVEKAKNACIPVIISKAPPMYQAIQLARASEVSLIGFSRGRRFNIYTDDQYED